MGEAKRREDARLDAYAWGKPWRPVPCCPACGSRRIVVGPLVDMPDLVQKHFTSDLAVCRDCPAVWEPFPAEYVEDPVCAEPCDNCAFRPGSSEQADRIKWRELLDSLKPDDAGAGGRFYCHKGVPIDMAKGPGNFLFPRRPVTLGEETLHQDDGEALTTYDTAKMRVCSGFLRVLWAWRDKAALE